LILSNEAIFGVNLYEIGLGEKIESMFYEMLASTGAVRRTLEKYIIMEKEKVSGR
jgi:fructuronate reductase